MGQFGPSHMFQRPPIFDMLKIMYLCSKVCILDYIYMEVYKAMNKKMFPSILKYVNQSAITLPSRYADLSSGFFFVHFSGGLLWPKPPVG